MKKVLLTLLISLVAAHLVAAQNKPDRKADRDGVKAEIADAKKQMQDPINALLTVAGVGEPDSFGKNVLFLGSASTGTPSTIDVPAPRLATPATAPSP